MVALAWVTAAGSGGDPVDREVTPQPKPPLGTTLILPRPRTLPCERFQTVALEVGEDTDSLSYDGAGGARTDRAIAEQTPARANRRWAVTLDIVDRTLGSSWYPLRRSGSSPGAPTTGYAARNATTLKGISSLKLDSDPLGSPDLE